MLEAPTWKPDANIMSKCPESTDARAVVMARYLLRPSRVSSDVCISPGPFLQMQRLRLRKVTQLPPGHGTVSTFGREVK